MLVGTMRRRSDDGVMSRERGYPRQPLLYFVVPVVVLAAVFGAALVFSSGAAPLLVLGLVLVLLILISFRYPLFAWGCYFASISATGVAFSVGPALVRGEMLALPLLVLCLARLRATRDLSGVAPLPLGTVLIALAYFSWATVTTFSNAPTPVPSLWILLQILIGFVAFALLRLNDAAKLDLVNIGSVILGLIATLSLVSWVARIFFGLPVALTPGVAPDGRLIGFSFETNIFASQCVGWIALSSRWWRKLSRSARVANVALFAAVLLAATRAAWIALVLLLAISAIESAKRSLKWVWGLMFGFMVLLLAVPTAGFAEAESNSLAWRIDNLFTTDEGTGAYRAGIYETALADIDSPLRAFVGSGINSFSQFHLLDPTGVSASYLSSIWIATLYDTGFIGFVLFFALFISIVYSRASKLDGIVVLAVLMVCASVTNLIWFQYPWVYLALLSAPTVTARTKARREILHPSDFSRMTIK